VKRVLAVFFCSICLTLALRAQPFRGDSRGRQGDRGPELSDSVLGGCLDSLFASGLIATNESVGRVENGVFLASNFGIPAAREAWWIILPGLNSICEPPDDSRHHGGGSRRWRLVRVRDGCILAEGVTPPPAYKEMTAEERRNDL
jgi:hypothetical protein